MKKIREPMPFGSVASPFAQSKSLTSWKFVNIPVGIELRVFIANSSLTPPKESYDPLKVIAPLPTLLMAMPSMMV